MGYYSTGNVKIYDIQRLIHEKQLAWFYTKLRRDNAHFPNDGVAEYSKDGETCHSFNIIENIEELDDALDRAERGAHLYVGWIDDKNDDLIWEIWREDD